MTIAKLVKSIAGTRQRLYKLNEPFQMANDMNSEKFYMVEYILISNSSHPEVIPPETMAFVADEDGRIVDHDGIEMYPGYNQDQYIFNRLQIKMEL